MMTFMMKILLLSLGFFAVLAVIANAQSQSEKATFAGGCFWCMESAFEKLDGVIDVVSGYAGGNGQNPTYED